MFDEHVFSPKMQGLLRRALYFIGDGDYRREYYEEIINDFLASLKENDSVKEKKKKLAGAFLASQMIAQYAADIKVYKIAIMVTEYLIIRFWKYLLENSKFESQLYVDWLLKFLTEYEKWSQKYYESVKYCCEGKNRIPAYNPVEQRVTLYEMLGYLVTYAYYLSFRNAFSKESSNKSQEICNSIIDMINNHPQFFYAPYDRDIGIISMLYRLLMRLRGTTDIETLIYVQTIQLAHYYLMYRKYPTPVDTFDDAVNIDMGFPAEEYMTSAFWGTMLEWIVLMNQKELYDKLREFLTEDLNEVTKCVWFLRADEELKLYDAYAMNQAGDGVAFEPEKTFEEMKEQVTFIMDQYSQETFSFETNSFPALEFIVSRYYGYLVRVKVEPLMNLSDSVETTE